MWMVRERNSLGEQNFRHIHHQQLKYPHNTQTVNEMDRAETEKIKYNINKMQMHDINSNKSQINVTTHVM